MLLGPAWRELCLVSASQKLSALVSLIALINACNRMGVIVGQPRGGYESGHW